MQTVYSVNPAIAGMDLTQIDDSTLVSIYNVCSLFDQLKLKSNYDFAETIDNSGSILSRYRKAKKNGKAKEFENLLTFLFSGLMFRVKISAEAKMTSVELKVFVREFITDHPHFTLEGVIMFCQNAWKGRWQRGNDGKIYNRLDGDVLNQMLKNYTDEWCVYKEASVRSKGSQFAWGELSEEDQKVLREKAIKDDTLEWHMMTEEERLNEHKKGSEYINILKERIKENMKPERAERVKTVHPHITIDHEFVDNALRRVYSPNNIVDANGYARFQYEFFRFGLSQQDYLTLRLSHWSELTTDMIVDKLSEVSKVVNDMKASHGADLQKLTVKQNRWRRSLGLPDLINVV